MKLKILVLIALLCFGTAACETSDDDSIAQAQACLDKATDATSANDCATKVSGITGPRAAIIRCSASFIAQGYTTNSTKFLDAFRALKEAGGASSGNTTIDMMVHLAFDTTTNSSLAVQYCNETGIGGMIMFANMVHLATTLTSLAGGGTPSPAQLAAQIDNMSNAEAGAAATAVADNYCKNSSTHDAEFCGQFNAAVADGSMTDEQKGCLLKQHLAQGTGTTVTCP